MTEELKFMMRRKAAAMSTLSESTLCWQDTELDIQNICNSKAGDYIWILRAQGTSLIPVTLPHEGNEIPRKVECRLTDSNTLFVFHITIDNRLYLMSRNSIRLMFSK